MPCIMQLPTCQPIQKPTTKMQQNTQDIAHHIVICHQVHNKLHTIVNGLFHTLPPPRKMLPIWSAPKTRDKIWVAYGVTSLVTYIANLHCCVIAIPVHWPSKKMGVSTKEKRTSWFVVARQSKYCKWVSPLSDSYTKCTSKFYQIAANDGHMIGSLWAH